MGYPCQAAPQIRRHCSRDEGGDALGVHAAAAGARSPFQPIAESQTRHAVGSAHRPLHGQICSGRIRRVDVSGCIGRKVEDCPARGDKRGMEAVSEPVRWVLCAVITPVCGQRMQKLSGWAEGGLVCVEVFLTHGKSTAEKRVSNNPEDAASHS